MPSGENEEKGAGSVWKNMAETRRVARAREDTAVSAPRASSEAGGTASGERTGEDVTTCSGKRFTMTKPRSEMSDIEKIEMRRDMYQSQVIGGRFEAGPKAKYDPARFRQQSDCTHRFEELQWGSNGTAVYAKCKACGLKSVVHYTVVKAENKPKAKAAAAAPAGEDPWATNDP